MSPLFFKLSLSISSTFFLVIPSKAKTVLLHPIVGMSTNTPKCDASPNPFIWWIPFPSTKITWGINSLLLFFNFSINFTKCLTSLKARKPGIYGSSIFINS